MEHIHKQRHATIGLVSVWQDNTTLNISLTIDEFSILLVYDHIIFHQVLMELDLQQRHYYHPLLRYKISKINLGK